MAVKDTKWVKTSRCDSEHEANSVIDEWKTKASQGDFTVTKTKIDYKTKKDRKTGDILDEWWMVEVTLVYDE